MTIESEHDLDSLKYVGAVVRDVLAHMGGLVRPGISTAELDAHGERQLAEAGVRPATACCARANWSISMYRRKRMAIGPIPVAASP